MPLLDVAYDRVQTSRKSGEPDLLSDDRAIARQLDELERISTDSRDKQLGADYFTDIAEFYNLDDDQGTMPSYKPQVKVPQLQTLVLNEATDITDSSPKVYITAKGDRDKEREQYFQANWRQGCYNNRILEAFIWAMLSNLGFLQIGFDPITRRGKGSTWVEMRHPQTVYPDPNSRSESDWSFVQIKDWLYIDEVRRRWPDKGKYVRPHLYASGGPSDPFGSTGGSLNFPEYSPLSVSSDSPSRKLFRDNLVCVRYAYMFDNTREVVRDYSGTRTKSDLLVHPRFEYSYPDGRWITECEGVILADGNNWCPQLPDDERGTFPLVRISAMPSITNFWGPPPVKLTRSLQRLGERMYTQNFENFVRLNNGVIVIENNTGIDPSGLGWLPGEVVMINQGTKPPLVLNPPPFAQNSLQFPASLFALQKELQGFSQARQGESGGGNVSADLFDAAVWQSKPMTRLRGRLLAESLQRLASIVFYVQARYQQLGQRLSEVEGGEVVHREWSPASSLDDYDIHLDPGSLQVLSSTALKSVVMGLAKANLLPTETILESVGLPNASEVAEKKLQELELGALQKLKRPR